jgi:hypothetical protein
LIAAHQQSLTRFLPIRWCAVWLVHHLHGLLSAAPAACLRLHAAHRLRGRCHQQAVLCTHTSGNADRAPTITARQISARHVRSHEAYRGGAAGATHRHRHHAAWTGRHRCRVSSKPTHLRCALCLSSHQLTTAADQPRYKHATAGGRASARCLQQHFRAPSSSFRRLQRWASDSSSLHADSAVVLWTDSRECRQLLAEGGFV